MTYLRLLAVSLPLVLVACEQKKTAVSAPGKTSNKQSAPELSIGAGIVISFPHQVLLDVTSGSSGRKIRKLLLQTQNTPVEDAVEQLTRTLRLAKFTRLNEFDLPDTRLICWTKDGQPLDTTSFGISIQTSSSIEENLSPSGGNTLEIHSKID